MTNIDTIVRLKAYLQETYFGDVAESGDAEEDSIQREAKEMSR